MIEWYTSKSWEHLPTFLVRYSCYFRWIDTEETPLAYYRWSDGMLRLLPAFLEIDAPKYKGRIYLRDLSSICYVKRKLWLPLLFGCISGAFALALLFSNLIPIWWGVGIGISGTLLTYYGWQGEYRLELQELGRFHQIRLPAEEKRILKFLEKVGKQRRKALNA